MVPALMAARGAADSVNTRELEVPLLLFSIFLSTGGSARQTHALFSAQYHTLCFYLSHRRTAAQRTLAHPALVERDEREDGEPVGVSLSVSRDDQLAEQERRDLFISINHALTYISPIYLYLHTCCFVRKDEKTILQNMYLWRPDRNCSSFLSLPFTVSAKHSGLE